VYLRARYEHVITETCPGHAVMLTGSYAGVNGIVANQWYDPVQGRPVYCAEDGSVTLVGARGPGGRPGDCSAPRSATCSSSPRRGGAGW
jgi:hypothetical protein